MLLVLAVAAVVCRLAFDTDHIDYLAVLMGPSDEHWLGTDSVGRDVMVRTLAAAAVDLPERGRTAPQGENEAAGRQCRQLQGA